MASWKGAPFEPRRWQREALPIIVAALRRGEKTIVSAVTGSGKSILIAELIAEALKKMRADQVIVVTTPTQALVRQLAATVGERIGHELVGMFYGQKKQSDRRVVVACNPSVELLGFHLKVEQKQIGFLICDEVHRTEGEQIQAAITALYPVCRVGFTATPFRADEAETLQLWKTIAYQYTLGDAWRDGVLVPFVPVPWSGAQRAADVDRICLDMMLECAGPGVVSALTISDAEAYADYLTAHDYRAEAVHSRRKRAENDATLARLMSGELRCVVHVAMLSEGVDIPGLRWICLRRPVGSRVRFVQEVGRVLRVLREPDLWGEKTSAKVLDPHALFAEHGISHPAALGEAPPKELKEAPLIGSTPGGLAEMRPAVQISAVSSWCRRLLLVLQADGMAAQSKYPGDAQWRQKKASAKSAAAADRMKWAIRFLPASHRAACRIVIGNPERFKAGAVSDLLGVLIAVADASHRGWVWPDSIEIPAIDLDV